MNWHNGKMWKEFQRRTSRQAERYRALGMTEEQLEELYRFDLEVFRSDRRFYRHIQDLEELANHDETWEDILSRLFPEAVTAPPEEPFRESRDWLEDIGSPELLDWVLSLSGEARELLGLLVFEGLSQREVSRLRGCTPQNVNQALARLRRSALKRLGPPSGGGKK